ncbi:MAG: hypothetical protein RJQ07_12815 [Pseudomonadales bacterium]
MNVTYWIHANHALTYSVFEGRITLTGFQDFRTTLAQDARHNPVFGHLLDLRLADLSLFGTDQIRSIAQSRIHEATSRRAIVVARALDFGIARMADAWFHQARPHSKTFRDLNAAVEWLEVEPGTDLKTGPPTTIEIAPEED